MFKYKNIIVLFFIFLCFCFFSCEKKERVDKNSNISLSIVMPESNLYSCYKINQKIQFVAKVNLLGDIIDEAVTWEADRGDITSTGEYTTPSEPCEVVITARFRDCSNSVRINIFYEVPDVKQDNFYFLVDSVIPTTAVDKYKFWTFGGTEDMEKEHRAIYIDGGCYPEGVYTNNVSKNNDYMKFFFGTTDNPKNFLEVQSDPFEGRKCFKMKVPSEVYNSSDVTSNDWKWLSLMFSSIPDRVSGDNSVFFESNMYLNSFLLENYNTLHFAYKLDEDDLFEDGSLLSVEIKRISIWSGHYYRINGIYEQAYIGSIYSYIDIEIDSIRKGEWQEMDIVFDKIKRGFSSLSFTLKNRKNNVTFNKGTLYIDDVYFYNQENQE